jgi:hypothetical protein
MEILVGTMVNKCMICYEEASSDIDCNGPIHKVVILEEEPVEEIQVNKYGVYVNPKTGKIVKAKALNNPVTLGME